MKTQGFTIQAETNPLRLELSDNGTETVVCLPEVLSPATQTHPQTTDNDQILRCAVVGHSWSIDFVIHRSPKRKSAHTACFCNAQPLCCTVRLLSRVFVLIFVHFLQSSRYVTTVTIMIDDRRPLLPCLLFGTYYIDSIQTYLIW